MGHRAASGTRSLARRWGPWFLALLGLVLAWSIVRAARDLDRLPVHGEYLVPRAAFLYGSIGMQQALGSPLDPDGVLLYDYGGQLGRQYNPLFIADFALALVPHWAEPEGQRLLRANLDHLLATATTTSGGYLAFPYNFDFRAAGEVAPWYSAMAQARAGQALMWGWRLSGERAYLEGAKSAILAMTDPGVSPPFGRPLARGVWLKEFPGNRYNVLDGSLVALVGVHQVWKGLPEDDPDRQRIWNLFAEALTGFKANQTCFTSPFGGVYFNDAGQRPTQSYYDIIMTQLRYLSAIDKDVAEIANRYSLDDKSGAKRLAYAWWLPVNRWWNKRGFLREPCVR